MPIVAACRALPSSRDGGGHGWIAHAGYGDTMGLREHVLQAFILKPGNVPGKARR